MVSRLAADTSPHIIPSMPMEKVRRLIILWCGTFSAWGLLCLVLSIQIHHSTTLALEQCVRTVAQNSVVWPVMLPLIYAITRRFPLGLRDRARHMPVQIVFAAASLVIATAVQVKVHGPIEGKVAMQKKRIEEQRLQTFALHNAIILLALLAGCHAIHFYKTSAAHEMQALELKNRLIEARVQTLTMQLHPHFLFNSLNTIAGLMHENLEQADAATVALADFLRLTLSHSQSHKITLREELQIVRSYLSVESIRFGPRLEVAWDIKDVPLNATVPSLLLQPIVENAFRHAFSKVPGLCKLSIRATTKDRMLHISVSDNGPGVLGKNEAGIGLANTQSRLNAMYGSEWSLQLNGQLGCNVEIELPLQFS